jgi:hypothetical protein
MNYLAPGRYAPHHSRPESPQTAFSIPRPGAGALVSRGDSISHQPAGRRKAANDLPANHTVHVFAVRKHRVESPGHAQTAQCLLGFFRRPPQAEPLDQAEYLPAELLVRRLWAVTVAVAYLSLAICYCSFTNRLRAVSLLLIVVTKVHSARNALRDKAAPRWLNHFE